MKTCTKCLITKEFMCFYKRSSRPSLREVCKVCHNAAVNARNKAVRTKEYLRNQSQVFKQKNPGYNAKKAAEFRKNHPEKIRAWNAESKAAKINATPGWITQEQRLEIVQIYANCPKGFQVDHIVPLRGKEVRGLHVPWNLQYLTIEQNSRKGNRLVG